MGVQMERNQLEVGSAPGHGSGGSDALCPDTITLLTKCLDASDNRNIYTYSLTSNPLRWLDDLSEAAR